MMSLIRPKTTPVRDQKQLYNAVRLSLLQITAELPDQLLCNQPCLPSSAHDSKRHGTPGVLPRNIGNLVVVNAAKGYEVLGSAQPTLAPPVTSLCIAPHRITSCVCVGVQFVRPASARPIRYQSQRQVSQVFRVPVFWEEESGVPRIFVGSKLSPKEVQSPRGPGTASTNAHRWR